MSQYDRRNRGLGFVNTGKSPVPPLSSNGSTMIGSTYTPPPPVTAKPPMRDTDYQGFRGDVMGPGSRGASNANGFGSNDVMHDWNSDGMGMTDEELDRPARDNPSLTPLQEEILNDPGKIDELEQQVYEIAKSGQSNDFEGDIGPWRGTAIFDRLMAAWNAGRQEHEQSGGDVGGDGGGDY